MVDIDKSKLGALARQERNKRKYSQSQSAELLGISVRELSDIENGYKTMSLNTFANFIRSFNLNCDETLQKISIIQDPKDLF